jgi:DNA-binding transcriptional LysR family regulator
MINNINIELRHIYAFTTVAKTLNFRRAAELLYMTQPGLTRIIKRLEEEIGVLLFNRTTRSVKLTEAGSIFLKETLLAVDKINSAIGKAQSVEAGNTGYLKVAYMGFAINGILPSILKSFHKQYPGIRTDLIYLSTEEQKKKIIDSELDIGFLIGPFISPEVDQLVISHEKLMVVMPENHPLSTRRKVPIADLALEPFILGSPKDWTAFLPIIVDLCHKANFNPNVRQYVDTSEGIFGMVAAGLGVTIYTESAVNVRNYGLVTRPLADKSAVIETAAVWLHNNISPSLDRFKIVLKEFKATT